MPTVLKVWSFHKSLTNTDKEDLLRHFGAVTVRHVGRQGRDEAVLASFKSDVDCKYALGKLHQQEVLGERLKAVYKDSSLPTPTPQPHRLKENVKPDDSSQQEKLYKRMKEFETSLCAISSNLGISHPIPPSLKYLYPPPSPTVIANIAQTLAEVPKFYTQVLHLMNKMNLSTPFEPLKALPPVYLKLLEIMGHLQREEADKVTENYNEGETIGNMDGTAQESSESESELESEEDGQKGTTRTPAPPIKRRLRPKNTIRKKPKLSLLKQSCMPHPRAPELSMKDVFESSETPGTKRLELRLKGTVLPSSVHNVMIETCRKAGGFGKMESVAQSKESSSSADMVEWQRESEKYITKEELQNNMVAKSDWPILPVFKNYTPGEPSPKLYIKNLAKTTTEKDLKYIFGRYVFWQNEEEASRFSICLMKEGRMKGQAFITYPGEKEASEALKDTNGYILNDKPMVVAFGKVKKQQSNEPSQNNTTV